MNAVAPFERVLNAFDSQYENTLRSLWFVGDARGEFRHIEVILKVAREANTLPAWLVFLGDVDIDRQPLRVEWKRKKHGAEYRRQWRKVHLGIDAQTLEIRAIEVTDNGVVDAPMLPELLGQIPPDEAVASVSGDGACDTKACHAAIIERGAQAVIPPRKNAQPWKVTLAGAL